MICDIKYSNIFLKRYSFEYIYLLDRPIVEGINYYEIGIKVNSNKGCITDKFNLGYHYINEEGLKGILTPFIQNEHMYDMIINNFYKDKAPMNEVFLGIENNKKEVYFGYQKNGYMIGKSINLDNLEECYYKEVKYSRSDLYNILENEFNEEMKGLLKDLLYNYSKKCDNIPEYDKISVDYKFNYYIAIYNHLSNDLLNLIISILKNINIHCDKEIIEYFNTYTDVRIISYVRLSKTLTNELSCTIYLRF